MTSCDIGPLDATFTSVEALDVEVDVPEQDVGVSPTRLLFVHARPLQEPPALQYGLQPYE